MIMNLVMPPEVCAPDCRASRPRQGSEDPARSGRSNLLAGMVDWCPMRPCKRSLNGSEIAHV
jgi:hypothetical protein